MGTLEVRAAGRRTASGAGSRLVALPLVTVLVTVLALGTSVSVRAATDDAFGASWPEGEGRELTGAWCGGCHSLNLVMQQGLTRDGWDELLHWMTEKQNMPPLEGERRDQVLDYLAANFDTGRGERRSSADEAVPIPDPVQGIRLPPLEIRPTD